jgi:outer membrane protein assembly factor BamB
VLCLDRHTGKVLWRQTATKLIPHEGAHRDNNFASASPTTDGERLYCWFGSAGLFCYDLDGNKLWERNLGKIKMGASLGEGCSPVVHDGKIVIVRDHSRQSSIEVLNAKTASHSGRLNATKKMHGPRRPLLRTAAKHKSSPPHPAKFAVTT